MHPFLAARFDQDRYLLLDGTSLFRKLADIGLLHVPVQVCSHRSLKVSSQKLGLIDFTLDDLIRLSTKYPRRIMIGNGRGSKPNDSMQLEFTFVNCGQKQVWLRHSNGSGCPVPLENVFRAIASKGRYLPIAKRITSCRDSVYKAATCSGTVKVPSFGVDDLISAAVSGRLFPPGIISVSSDCRVFNIDFPLSVLESDISLQDKELFLQDLIAFREQSCRTSLFEGRIYLLNR